MPELTIGRMAKLYRLHRSTLYEAVEKGRITAGRNGKDQRVIDLSEMIRVYGEPPGQARQIPTDPTPSQEQSLPDALQPLLNELAALRNEVSELRQAMLRLPAPQPIQPSHGQSTDTQPERPETPQEPRKAPTKAKGSVSFADIEARLAARLGKQS